MQHVSCKNCSLAHLCIPFSLNQEQLDQLDLNIKQAKPVRRKETLYTAGTSFKKLYVVRAGAFKSVMDNNGAQQIVNFYLPGEIIGFCGLASQTHITTTTALLDSYICELSNTDLMELTKSCPSAQEQLMKLMSEELVASTQTHFHGEAEEKLLRFFQQLAKRFARRGLSSKQFELPMAKQDIANYLGMANETVSRLIARLQDKGKIKLEKKLITLLR